MTTTGTKINAALLREPPVTVETATRLPAQPSPQQARETVTQEPKIVPIPAQETAKEAAQRLLREAAEKHRRRAAVMQGRLDAGQIGVPIAGSARINGGGVGTSGAAAANQRPPPLPRSIRMAQLGALAVAVALIAVLLRRMMLMSNTP